jgi:hypothetical protein
MYNLNDKYLRGNSIGCCLLYVSYYFYSTHIKMLQCKIMYLRGNSIGTDDGRRRRRTTHFKSFQYIESSKDFGKILLCFRTELHQILLTPSL